jgi:hypothetical protein
VLKSEDYRAISGAQKAAILMLALGEEQCTRLFSMMHEDEIKDDSAPFPFSVVPGWQLSNSAIHKFQPIKRRASAQSTNLHAVSWCPQRPKPRPLDPSPTTPSCLAATSHPLA